MLRTGIKKLTCTYSPTKSIKRKKESWSPQQYNKFQQQRTAPFNELLNLVKRRDHTRFIDLGCGTGETDVLILTKFPDSDVLGCDNSLEMLEKARNLQKSYPGKLKFEFTDIQNLPAKYFTQPKFDVLISNAALHWIPNHSHLIPHLLNLIDSGSGQVAIQVPTNLTQEFYVMLDKTADLPIFDAHLKGWRRKWELLEMDEYANILWRAGFKDILIYEKVFPHVLEEPSQVVEWIKGSGMLAYTSKLPSHLHDKYAEEFLQKILEKHPKQQELLFPFRRLFIYGSKFQ